MYTLDEIDDKIGLATALRLSGAELLRDRARAQTICNGIGAGWMPAKVRGWISDLTPTLILAADIHDIRYEIGGSEFARRLADTEMLDNGIALANAKYGRFDPRRYLTQFAMLQYYIKLRQFGALAFNKSAGGHNKEEET